MGHSEKISREGCKIISGFVQRREIIQEQAEILEPKHCHAPQLIGYSRVHNSLRKDFKRTNTYFMRNPKVEVVFTLRIHDK